MSPYANALYILKYVYAKKSSASTVWKAPTPNPANFGSGANIIFTVSPYF